MSDSLRRDDKFPKIPWKQRSGPVAKFCMFAGLVVMVMAPVLFYDQLSGKDLAGEGAKKEAVYAMYRNYQAEFPAVADISPMQAMELLDGGRVLFVDVRQPGEMAVSMLPQAVTAEAFRENPGLGREKTVVAYCTIGSRSGKFSAAMAAEGITVANLQGGILAWVLEGGEVYDHAGESRRIHVYGPQWNYPADGHEAVMFNWLDRIF